MDKIQELLSVLDMEEYGQVVTLLDLSVITSEEYDNYESGREFSLADLAFRLQNEVGSQIENGYCYVDWHLHMRETHEVPDCLSYSSARFFALSNKPEYIIIAALIAKEMSDAKN